MAITRKKFKEWCDRIVKILPAFRAEIDKLIKRINGMKGNFTLSERHPDTFNMHDYYVDIQQNAKLPVKLVNSGDEYDEYIYIDSYMGRTLPEGMKVFESVPFDPNVYGMNGAEYYDSADPSKTVVSNGESHYTTNDPAKTSAIHKWTTRSIFTFKASQYLFDRNYFKIPYNDFFLEGGNLDVMKYYPYIEEIYMTSVDDPTNIIRFINVQYHGNELRYYGGHLSNFMITFTRTRWMDIPSTDEETSKGTPYKAYLSMYASDFTTEPAFATSKYVYFPTPHTQYGEELLNTKWDCRIIWRKDCWDTVNKRIKMSDSLLVINNTELNNIIGESASVSTVYQFDGRNILLLDPTHGTATIDPNSGNPATKWVVSKFRSRTRKPSEPAESYYVSNYELYPNNIAVISIDERGSSFTYMKGRNYNKPGIVDQFGFVLGPPVFFHFNDHPSKELKTDNTLVMTQNEKYNMANDTSKSTMLKWIRYFDDIPFFTYDDTLINRYFWYAYELLGSGFLKAYKLYDTIDSYIVHLTDDSALMLPVYDNDVAGDIISFIPNGEGLDSNIAVFRTSNLDFINVRGDNNAFTTNLTYYGLINLEKPRAEKTVASNGFISEEVIKSNQYNGDPVVLVPGRFCMDLVGRNFSHTVLPYLTRSGDTFVEDDDFKEAIDYTRNDGTGFGEINNFSIAGMEMDETWVNTPTSKNKQLIHKITCTLQD